MSRFKEPVIWAMIVIVCILAIVLVLRYKDKIDGYGKSQPPLTTTWIGVMVYGVPAGSGWGGEGTKLEVVDGTIKIGLRSDGVIVWRQGPKAEGKK